MRFSPWNIAFFFCLAFLCIPIGYVAFGLLGEPTEAWAHIAEHLLSQYLANTIWLLLGTLALALLFAVPSAWLLSAYTFPFSRQLRWIMAIPLAVPPYIAAFTYADMFGYTGTFQKMYHILAPGKSLPIDLMTLQGAVFIMAAMLYPYIYLGARASFQGQSNTLVEAARMLGRTGWQVFWQIALPLARPAIAGGLLLVAMETMNEYGTMSYFGVNTFTSGIFKAWFSMGDMGAAVRLSAILLLFVLVLMFLERWQRGKGRFDAGAKNTYLLAKRPLSGWKGWLAFSVCAWPPMLGFGIPVAQLLHWAISAQQLRAEFWAWVGNTCLVAFSAGFLTLLVALIMVYAIRLNGERSWLMRSFSKVANLGYAVPGAVIAVGILASFLSLDHLLNALWGFLGKERLGLIFSGTLMALTLAYMIRFLALAFQPLEAGMEQTAKRLDEASRLLGASPIRTLLRINLPILRNTLLGAGFMVVVEVMKELPLTLIMRPFNFDTLATKAFELAGDEQLHEASVGAMVIVIIGLLPLLGLLRMERRR